MLLNSESAVGQFQRRVEYDWNEEYDLKGNKR